MAMTGSHLYSQSIKASIIWWRLWMKVTLRTSMATTTCKLVVAVSFALIFVGFVIIYNVAFSVDPELLNYGTVTMPVMTLFDGVFIFFFLWFLPRWPRGHGIVLPKRHLVSFEPVCVSGIWFLLRTRTDKMSTSKDRNESRELTENIRSTESP